MCCLDSLKGNMYVLVCECMCMQFNIMYQSINNQKYIYHGNCFSLHWILHDSTWIHVHAKPQSNWRDCQAVSQTLCGVCAMIWPTYVWMYDNIIHMRVCTVDYMYVRSHACECKDNVYNQDLLYTQVAKLHTRILEWEADYSQPFTVISIAMLWNCTLKLSLNFCRIT